MPSVDEWVRGRTDDGQALPVDEVNRYRAIADKINAVRAKSGIEGIALLPKLEPLPAPLPDVSKSSEQRCIHRGEVLRTVNAPGCNSCGGSAQIFRCAIHGECTTVPTYKVGHQWQSCSRCPDKQIAHRPRRPFDYRAEGIPEFVTMARLMEDCRALASLLPADTSRIIGVARSGLCAATMVAMLLHRPIDILRQSRRDLIEGGNGWRLSRAGRLDGPVVVIDDTVMTGNSFKDIMPIVRQTHPRALAAAVYVNPAANLKPDLWVRDLPWPHILEWNVFNSVMSPHIATDFDGILCHDCSREDDDNGPRYDTFLRTVKPLYLSRKEPIPLIVTARLERYRAQTVEWLHRHGVRFISLQMGQWQDPRYRSLDEVVKHKAYHYRHFLKQNHAIKPPMFVESCPIQAERIAKQSGGLVVCPAAGRCYR